MDTLIPIAGIRLATVCAGIKKADRRDLVAIELDSDCNVAAVFTQNAFCAAPVTLAKKHLQMAKPAYLLINTGNANAGTGQQGLDDAVHCCQQLARIAGCETQQVLPFSTGVIGENLPRQRIVDAMPQLCTQLAESAWEDAAHGILTTDTVPKGRSVQFFIGAHTVTITGIAKGSGMIRPNMATMLAYIATDAGIEQSLLQQCLQQAVAQSFNRITVDGDTSTNDACVLIATGKSGAPAIETRDENFHLFSKALGALCEDLAKDMVRDGEGATKLISIKVLGGASQTDCEQIAYTVAHSPLVKTAMFAADPNWGRILAAVGRAGVSLDIDQVEIYLDHVCLVRHGGRAADYTEEAGQAVMDQNEITICIDLKQGNSQAQLWTCDFSYDYVRINAEYRT